MSQTGDGDCGCGYRFSKRDDAHAELKAAQEKGDQEAIEKFSKRTVKVTREHVADVKKLLTLMGVPYVEVLADVASVVPCSRVVVCERLQSVVERGMYACAGTVRGRGAVLRHVHGRVGVRGSYR